MESPFRTEIPNKKSIETLHLGSNILFSFTDGVTDGSDLESPAESGRVENHRNAALPNFLLFTVSHHARTHHSSAFSGAADAAAESLTAWL